MQRAARKRDANAISNQKQPASAVNQELSSAYRNWLRRVPFVRLTNALAHTHEKLLLLHLVHIIAREKNISIVRIAHKHIHACSLKGIFSTFYFVSKLQRTNQEHEECGFPCSKH